jgi:oligopeptide/dipeptide ABC transporter ATP-binding protein
MFPKYLGRVVEDRPTEDLFTDPRHPYTAALLAAAPHLGATKRSGEAALPGEPPGLLAVPTGCPFHPRCSRVQDLCRRDTPALTGPSLGHAAACHFAWPSPPVGGGEPAPARPGWSAPSGGSANWSWLG